MTNALAQATQTVFAWLRRHDRAGLVLGALGGVVSIVSIFWSWAWQPQALDNMTYTLSPSPLQIIFAIPAALLLVCLVLGELAARRSARSPLGRMAWHNGARAAASTALLYIVLIVFGIGVELGGLVNADPGAWLALAGALLGWLGTRMAPQDRPPTLFRVKSPQWLQITAIVALLALAMFAAAFGLGQTDAVGFIAFGVFAIGIFLILGKLGVMGWVAVITAANRPVLVLTCFVVAYVFPFTQGGSDANMSIATQVLIFAATAMGLNIVVGLVGLLDLGYIAFLGAGAFTAAMLSNSAFATLHWHPPFLVVVLISGCVSALLGLVIGTPTLRVSGDYLAIVTLAFGEIFRITMNNLDGNDGPDLTHGSNGIPGVPDLSIFGFNFGQPHTLLGVEIGRFANYYWLMLVVIAVIILIFTNLNRSRIGRGWVAIREDERAAEAMGINTFGLKLLAFAGGAFLAGVAGSVKAHVDVSVTPDQYVFMESSFLVAGIVLGGMGTVGGVLAGAVILKLLPEKLRFFSDYRLLIFALTLVFMMRFRPEGLVPNRRRQLEFHDEDEEMAEELAEALPGNFVQSDPHHPVRAAGATPAEA
ncbi:branched-chain amino acid transport system permease protein [Propionibacterium cyclohexanicum]|uniref:Branched-chain amino acid transport system permease protein n=1 Tax=Propionibacterium cyclohexanicum TaxID=64702 RepID=A0A1H9T5D5_9ACTN|nr:branched-chain amino acid ABC transporter permease [Propionibacterium cyclohexanicum]SER91959.1 branched-chain amino acid transport system permease protein [Propionibacterium cyclohexanicum]